jgi:hypothetical protein
MKRLPLIFGLAGLALGAGFLALRREAEEGRSRPSGRGPAGEPLAEPSAAAGVEEPPAVPWDLALAASGASAGTLRITVHARGAPVAGARIFVAPAGTPEGRGYEAQADGTRTVTGLPPGEYELTARHPRYLPGGARVRVEAGRATDAILEIREGGRLYGIVTDAAGNPLAGATVQLLDGTTQLPVVPELRAWTDRAGRYVLEAVPEGEFGARFRHERFRPLDRMGLVWAGPGDAKEVNVALEEGTFLAGRVVDEAGAPVAGALVMGTNEGGGMARTDAEGRFALYGLGNAPISGSAAAPGYGTVYWRGVAPNTANLEVRLPRAGSLTGRVEAEPAPAWFAVCLSKYDAELGREVRVQTKSFAGKKEFALQDVAPGAYTVEVQAEGYEALDRPQVVVERGQAAGVGPIRLRKKP